MKILLLEDDVILNELIEEFLCSLQHDVVCEYDGLEAIDTIYNNHFDLLLLDVGVPSLSGFELLETLRDAKINVPAVFITSLSSLESLQEGFDLGCDDYIKKPFELKELELRINNIKRINKIDTNDIIQISNNIKYDFDNKMIIKDNNKITLANKEGQILAFFLKNKNRIISVDELCNNIWEYETTPSIATVRTYIKNLRKMLDSNMIVTVKGLGYKFEI